MSLTIKAHGGFDAPWFVVPDGTASDQRAYIIEAFGLEAEATEGLTLVEVLFLALPIWSASAAAVQGAGAQPVNAAKRAPAKKAAAKKAAPAPAPTYPAAEESVLEIVGETPVEAPAEEAPVDPNQHILDRLDRSFSKSDVQKVFAEFKDVFVKTPELQKVAQERVRSLAA